MRVESTSCYPPRHSPHDSMKLPSLSACFKCTLKDLAPINFVSNKISSVFNFVVSKNTCQAKFHIIKVYFTRSKSDYTRLLYMPPPLQAPPSFPNTLHESPSPSLHKDHQQLNGQSIVSIHTKGALTHCLYSLHTYDTIAKSHTITALQNILRYTCIPTPANTKNQT